MEIEGYLTWKFEMLYKQLKGGGTSHQPIFIEELLNIKLYFKDIYGGHLAMLGLIGLLIILLKYNILSLVMIIKHLAKLNSFLFLNNFYCSQGKELVTQLRTDLVEKL